MNIVPTKSQLRTLTLMAAGFDVNRRGAGSQLCHVNTGAVLVSRIRRTIADSLVDNGWATYDHRNESYHITSYGRDRIDVKAFVRALTTNQASR